MHWEIEKGHGERSAIDDANQWYKPEEKAAIEQFLRGADFHDFVKPGEEIYTEFVKYCNERGLPIASQSMVTRGVKRKFCDSLAYIGNNGGRFELIENCGKSTSKTAYKIEERDDGMTDDNAALALLPEINDKLKEIDERITKLENDGKKERKSAKSSSRDAEKAALADFFSSFDSDDEWQKYLFRFGLDYLKGMFIEYSRVNGVPIPYLDNGEKRYGAWITNTINSKYGLNVSDGH